MFRVLRRVGVALLMSSPFFLSAQEATSVAPRIDLGGFISAGSEREHYLRVLQLLGAVPSNPWTIQPFGFREASRLRVTGKHPWSARFAAPSDSSAPPPRFMVLRPRARVFLNTTNATRIVDGPTWTGRGLTLDAEAGVLWHWRGVALQAAPTVFLTQNAAFDLTPNSLTGLGAFRDPRFPDNIDRPQRFGTSSYGRFDGGETRFSIELPGIAFGASTAVQRWGPGYDAGLVLSPNAGGIPHVFLGSSTPTNARLFDVEWRYEFGRQPASAVASRTTIRIEVSRRSS